MSAQMSKREFERLLKHLDKINQVLAINNSQAAIISDTKKENDYWRNHIIGYFNSNTLHQTEEKYPEQTKRFREILDEMYQTHLKKNADYSAYNINGTGEVGLTVRFWDKCARLMNLMGFDIGTGKYTGAKKNLVLDESVLDTVMDAAVYSIIFKIYSEGKWGK